MASTWITVPRRARSCICCSARIICCTSATSFYGKVWVSAEGWSETSELVLVSATKRPRALAKSAASVAKGHITLFCILRERMLSRLLKRLLSRWKLPLILWL